MQRKILLAVCSVAVVSLTGGPLPSALSQQTDAPAAVKTYTPEQMAAAKKLALQIGGRLKEDADGNVVSIDMAAGRSWADDRQMQQLLVFPKLATLVVEGPGITDRLIPRLLEQRELASLTLKNTLVGDRGIAQLAALKSLKIVDLRVAPLITDKSMESLATLPNLRAVRLVGGNITDRGVAALLKIPQLSEIDVRNCRGVTKTGIQAIAEKETIRVLKLGGLAINDGALDVVAGMKRLTGLYLDNCSITDAGLAKLGQLSPDTLDIRQCAEITDQGLQVLASYRNLRQLTLLGVAAKGSALTKLPNPEKLIALNMAQSGITDAELPALAAMTHLESLNLNQTALTDAAVETLSKLTSLRQLTMTQTGVTSDATERLRKALPDCTIRAN